MKNLNNFSPDVPGTFNRVKKDGKESTNEENKIGQREAAIEEKITTTEADRKKRAAELLESVSKKAGKEYRGLLTVARNTIEGRTGDFEKATEMLKELDALLPNIISRRGFLEKGGKAAVGIYLAGEIVNEAIVSEALGLLDRSFTVSVDKARWIETYKLRDRAAWEEASGWEFSFIPGDRKKGEPPAKGISINYPEMNSKNSARGVKMPEMRIDVLYTRNGLRPEVIIESRKKSAGGKHETIYIFNNKEATLQGGEIYHRGRFLEYRSGENAAVLERSNERKPNGEWKSNAGWQQVLEFSFDHNENKSSFVVFDVLSKKKPMMIEAGEKQFVLNRDAITRKNNTGGYTLIDEEGVAIKDFLKEEYDAMYVQQKQREETLFVFCFDHNIENLPGIPAERTYRAELKSVENQQLDTAKVIQIYDVSLHMEYARKIATDMNFASQELEKMPPHMRAARGKYLLTESPYWEGLEIPRDSLLYRTLEKKISRYIQPTVKVE